MLVGNQLIHFVNVLNGGTQYVKLVQEMCAEDKLGRSRIGVVDLN